VDVRTLVEQSKAGNLGAFTELVQRFQGMAFGYAFSLLGDFHLAQDATQEAFIAGYFNLSYIQHPAAFPGWLRRIVHHQCTRLLRTQRVALVSLDHAAMQASAALGLERYAEQLDMQRELLKALNGLSQEQREVIVLFYMEDYSQQEIASFLDLPVTTVNNRLHAARKRLKRRLLPMTKDVLTEHGLPGDFAAKVGRIIQVRGPVIDVQFSSNELPPILSVVTMADAAQHNKQVLGVAQHGANGVVRCITIAPTTTMSAGMSVINTERPAEEFLPAEVVAQVVEMLGSQRADSSQHQGRTSEVLETGIKVIDLFCPYPNGGKIGIVGDQRTGKLVLVEELLHNLRRNQAPLALFAFAHAVDEVATWIGNTPTGDDVVQAIYVPAVAPTQLEHGTSGSSLDAVTYLSRSLGAAGLWPAIDPLRSTSRLLDATLVGQEHHAVAHAVRRVLQQAEDLHHGPEADDNLSVNEQTTIARARRLRAFCTQPFFVAEPFSKRSGQFVARSATIQAFKAILSGEYDHLPEEAFLHCGSIEQVVEKARTLASL